MGLVYLVASVGGGVFAVSAGIATGRELVTRLNARRLRRVGTPRVDMGAIETEDREESASRGETVR